MFQGYLDRKPAREIKTYQKLGGALKCLGLIASGAILLDMVLYGMILGLHGIYAAIAMGAIILGCNIEGYEREPSSPAPEAVQEAPVQNQEALEPAIPVQAASAFSAPAIEREKAINFKKRHTWGSALTTLAVTVYAGLMFGLVLYWAEFLEAKDKGSIVMMVAVGVVATFIGWIGVEMQAKNHPEIIKQYGPKK